MKEKWDAKVLIYLFFWLTSSCTLSCSLRLNLARFLLIFCLVRSVSTSEARSSTSASSSSFMHFWLVSSLKLDIWEVTLEAVASLVSSPTRLGDNSLLSEKRRLFVVFQRAHLKSTWLVRVALQNFTWGQTLNVDTPYRMVSLRPFPLDLITGGFFSKLHFVFAFKFRCFWTAVND